MKALERRVVKVGGSLLDVPHLGQRLRDWLAGEPEKLTLLLFGGGEIIEAVRRLDAIHRLEPRWVHWLCIDLLETTALLGEALFPEFSRAPTPHDLERVLQASESPAATVIVHVAAFYDASTARVDSGEPGSLHLPESWETTSDSLAACLARRAGADELVLLKSSHAKGAAEDPHSDEQPTKLQWWRRQGLVDDFLDRAAAEIATVRTVNLRDIAEE